jgi:choline dehydrogenase-like flavoprotein
MVKEYDIIIVGSGVGGGTAADYLTRNNTGLKIAIIESGPFITKEYFNQKEIDMTALYFNRGAVLSKNLEIGVAAGKTLGGSSAVYTGVSFRPPEDVLGNWRRKYGLEFLTDDYVNDSLDEIEKEISVHELPESWDNDNNKLFKKGAEALGIPVKRLKINTKNCQQQGFCNLGCTSGAKQGTLEVQIPNVIKRGVEIICNATVNTVEEHHVNITVKDAPEDTKQNQVSEGNYRLKSKVIILAAGVLNTPAILLRSAKKLKLKNKNIGRYLTLHPVFNVNGVYKDPIKNYRGFPKTCYTDYFSDTERFYLETSFYFPGVTAKNNPGYGKIHSDLMRDYHKMMSILILVHDQAEHHNCIAIDKKGNTVIDYTVSPETRVALLKALREATRIFFAAGCKKALIPGSDKMPLTPSDISQLETLISEKALNFSKTPLSSAHPQGGARMGNDPKISVCDLKGKVFGTNSIYVADASLFPTSVKVNPYETVMLLSKWVAENIDI